MGAIELEDGSLGVRARVWVPGEWTARLWVHLSDGRVLAFLLSGQHFRDDGLLAPLLECIADDVRGERVKICDPAFGSAHVLYAAPVLPGLSQELAAFEHDPDVRRFVLGLDEEIIQLLLALARAPTPPAITRRDGQAPHPLPTRFFASVRNYNRLATLDPQRRERRLQALRRFPALVAPILLTAHRSPNVSGGKRHAWREKDEAVEAAIDLGRDLTGALARHYGISRGLVRAPMHAAMWPAPDSAYRRRILRLLEALPANQRPTLAEFERWQLYLANYFRLLGEEGDRVAPEVHRGAFRLGWTRTFETAAKRYGDLHLALADSGDFLAAASERVAQPAGPSIQRLAAGWLACFGLLGLLSASHRWHRRRPAVPPTGGLDDVRLPAIVGTLHQDGNTAQELLTPRALAEEGDAMHHCVASYWPVCVAGDRVFVLRRADGERATAQYHPAQQLTLDVRYRLVQLRGPYNHPASRTMAQWARRVEKALNAPERQKARLAALEAVKLPKPPGGRPIPAWLDAQSEQQLLRVLAWLGIQPLGPKVILSAYVAGYLYHAGPKFESRLAPGQPLLLVREPDNPRDRLAVRLDWQGHTLGYVPRFKNADLARRLDAGERLSAFLSYIDPTAKPWQRVAFVVEVET